MEGSHVWNAGFDSSIGVSRESGYLYYGMADPQAPRMFREVAGKGVFATFDTPETSAVDASVRRDLGGNSGGGGLVGPGCRVTVG